MEFFDLGVDLLLVELLLGHDPSKGLEKAAVEDLDDAVEGDHKTILHGRVALGVTWGLKLSFLEVVIGLERWALIFNGLLGVRLRGSSSIGLSGSCRLRRCSLSGLGGSLCWRLLAQRSCRLLVNRLFFLDFFFFLWRFEQVHGDLFVLTLPHVLVSHHRLEVSHLGHWNFRHVQLWLFFFTGCLLGRCGLRGSLPGQLGLFLSDALLLSLLSLELGQSFSLQLLLLGLRLLGQDLLHVSALSLRPHLELHANISLKSIKEIVHKLGVVRHNVTVLTIIVPVRSLDSVQDFEAFLKSLVQHNMMNSFLHLVDLGSQVVLLPTSDVVVMVTALSKRNLEILFCFLEFLFVGIELCRVLFEEINDCGRDLLHTVIVLLQI